MVPVVMWGILALIGSELDMEDAILETPWIGWIYRKFFNPLTYDKADTVAMFQGSVRRAFMEVIGDLRSEKGLRALSEAEMRPAGFVISRICREVSPHGEALTPVERRTRAFYEWEIAGRGWRLYDLPVALDRTRGLMP
jgi:hypothetical protein